MASLFEMLDVKVRKLNQRLGTCLCIFDAATDVVLGYNCLLAPRYDMTVMTRPNIECELNYHVGIRIN